MEETLNLMLKDNVIDKKALLMRKHSLIGMTKDQALLIMNVVSLEEAGDKVTPNKIQKTFSYTKAELEHLMAELMEQGLVKIKMSKTGVEFKLNDLWAKLMKTYSKPSADAKAPEMEAWIERMLDMKLTPSNKRDIETWVKQKGSKRIISIVEGVFKMNVKNLTFKLIKEIYESEDKTKKAKQTELEKLIKFDWVSK